jgi:peptide/nickel transport system permease protein
MLIYVIRRVGSGVLVLLGLVAALFVLQHLSPADPARTLVGSKASPEALAAARHQLGLDNPLPVQFWNYLRDLAHLDLQKSLRTKHEVSTDLAGAIGPTVELLVFAAILAFAGGLLIGFMTLRGGWTARIVRVVMLATASIPPFLLALVLIIVFYSKLDVMPATGQSSVHDAPLGPTHLLLADSLLHGRPGPRSTPCGTSSSPASPWPRPRRSPSAGPSAARSPRRCGPTSSRPRG